MTDHTVRAFGEALDQLSSELVRLGGFAEAQLNDSLSAIARRDTGLANSVIERDAKLDVLHRDIEKRAVKILALRQPMANDLREVLSAWRIANELERVGDLAKSIAKRTLILNQSDPIQLTRSVDRMGRLVAQQLTQVLDAYGKRDEKPALEVWLHDEDIDAHYNSLFRELLTFMMEDPRTITPCAHLLFVAKNLERVGDHSTNIAEIVHYLVTGQDIDAERPKVDESEVRPPRDGDSQ
jgi:phosphate transport system protein